MSALTDRIAAVIKDATGVKWYFFSGATPEHVAERVVAELPDLAPRLDALAARYEQNNQPFHARGVLHAARLVREAGWPEVQQ